ncbi:hypothetical protein Tco_0343529 [Tanacetum coccineum]
MSLGPDLFTCHRSLSLWHCQVSHADGSNFKSTATVLKHYDGWDTPPLVIQTIPTFPKDNLIQGSSSELCTRINPTFQNPLVFVPNSGALEFPSLYEI